MRHLYIMVFCMFSLIQCVWSETVTIYATSKTKSLFEQCGCASIEGGLEARAGFMESAREMNPHSLLVDLGGFMPDIKKNAKSNFSLPNENKVDSAIGAVNLAAMNMMNYDAVLLGSDDLMFGSKFFKSNLPARELLLGANIKDSPDWIHPYIVKEIGSVKIGIIGASSLKTKTFRVNQEFVFTPATSSITPAVEKLRSIEKVDAVVLLAHEPPPIAKQWLSNYKGPKIDLVIALDFGVKLEKVGDCYLANAPSKGRALGAITFDVVKGVGIVNPAYNRVSLNPGQYANPAMREFLNNSYAAMTSELKLELTTVPVLMNLDMEKDAYNGYMGVKTCKNCHIEQYEQWRKTKHSYTYNQLLNVNRHWAPQCAQCHVTGFGHKKGFKFQPLSKDLFHVQCETCHGPGKKHVDEYGLGIIRRTPDKKLCAQCHTKKDSPKFDGMYDLFLKQVVH